MYHYGQNMKADKFQLYDYKSTEENNKHYGDSMPPLVDLPNFKDAQVPLAIFTAENDLIAAIDDTHWLRDQILSKIEDENEKNKVLVHYQEIKGGHGAFLFGANMDYLRDLIKLVRTYNPVSAEAEMWDIDRIDNEIDTAINRLSAEN